MTRFALIDGTAVDGNRRRKPFQAPRWRQTDVVFRYHHPLIAGLEVANCRGFYISRSCITGSPVSSGVVRAYNPAE